MDVSSKYFALFRNPGPNLLRHLWRFWLDIRRVGKARELFSFILWEITHRLYLYRFSNRYIQFTKHAGLSLVQPGAIFDQTLSSSFLLEHDWCFRALAIDWKFCLQATDGRWWGNCFSNPNEVYCSENLDQSVTLVHTFKHPITSLFISRQNDLFVCSQGIVYKKDSQGTCFKSVLQFSSSISYFLFNNGMTELPDGTLLIGEYGSVWQGQTWQNLAFLYSSSDGGETWEVSDFLIRQGVNKHIHLVRYSPLLKAVLLTDGDNKKQLWMNQILTDCNESMAFPIADWHLLTQYHHQTGGYTAVAETKEAVLFGSDYLGGTNFIVKTTDGKRFQKLVLPDPYRRSPVMNMVSRESYAGSEVWSVSYSCLSESARSLLMCTLDGGKSWNRVLDFDGTKYEVRLVNSAVSGSAELFISITEFGSHSDNHRHQVYKLESRYMYSQHQHLM
ncbi:exo-alpha-sialidase [Larkinella insperata]|uniref:Exo-alpha-sialidase n=1 Tax=Larkinella insperata TaxID=332158 RepID=A0ABW3QFG0_9BACT